MNNHSCHLHFSSNLLPVQCQRQPIQARLQELPTVFVAVFNSRMCTRTVATDWSSYDIENIEVLAKTPLVYCYFERYLLLICQELPDISGICLVLFLDHSLHLRSRPLWIDA